MRDVVQCAIVTFAKVAKIKIRSFFHLVFSIVLLFVGLCSSYTGRAIVYLAWRNVFPCGGGNRRHLSVGLWDPEWTYRIISF